MTDHRATALLLCAALAALLLGDSRKQNDRPAATGRS